MSMPEAGDLAPEIALPDETGTVHRLADQRGRWTIVYFYPKDDTPGCTVEACEFRDSYTDFEKRGAVVLGVSPDDVASHVKFKNKFSLPYALLADPEHEVAEQYGVWGEKKFGGKTYWGVKRSTFVIDADGNVAKVMHNVKPDGHPEQVLAALPS